MQLDNVLYSAFAQATSGDEGKVLSSDQVLDVNLSTPKELGGDGSKGTNPEQLFAAGYSACFLAALNYVAEQAGIKLPTTASVDARVGIGPIPNGFGLEADLTVSLPEVSEAVTQELIKQADIVCPFSNATRSNIQVNFAIV